MSPDCTTIVRGVDRFPVQSRCTGPPTSSPVISSLRRFGSGPCPTRRNVSESEGVSASTRSAMRSSGRYERLPNAASTPSTRTTGAPARSGRDGPPPAVDAPPALAAVDRQPHHVGADRSVRRGTPRQLMRSGAERRRLGPPRLRAADSRAHRLELHARAALELEDHAGFVASLDSRSDGDEHLPIADEGLLRPADAEPGCKRDERIAGESAPRDEPEPCESSEPGAQELPACELLRTPRMVVAAVEVGRLLAPARANRRARPG